MIFTDTMIKQLIDGEIISNSDYSLVNPWSLDVRLGHEIMVENEYDSEDVFCKVDLNNPDRIGYRSLKPQQFILAHTIEYLNLPEHIGAELYLKSSRAREGYDHAKAVWIDPGFSGSLTLELRNNLTYHDLPIVPGIAIAQLVFYWGEKPQHSYRNTGRYNDRVGVVGSLG